MSKFEGLTVDEAIQNGLKALKLTKADVAIEVIDPGKKGFLGMGRKNASVALTPLKTEKPVAATVAPSTTPATPATNTPEAAPVAKVAVPGDVRSDDEAITELAVYLTEMTQALGAPALVKVVREKSVITFQLENDKPGLLIGKHGKVLNALQYLAQVFIHRLAKNKLSVVVNVGNYRERRAAAIERLATNTAEKVMRTGRPVYLEPMPAFERKQIHAILSEYGGVTTYSEGEEPFRYLVVEEK